MTCGGVVVLYRPAMSGYERSSIRMRVQVALRQPGSRQMLLELALFVVASSIHLALIAVVPRGLFIDEASIGYNAHQIATTGKDEFGVSWPLYFRAFGEYKNPVYVYLMAMVFKLFGYSVWTTRFTSFLCWFVGTWGFYALGRRLWSDGVVRLFLLLSLSFTPWLFALSRVCFELIVLYPVLALYMYATYRGFEEGSRAWAATAGAAIGLSIYAYTTFRLLGPLHVLATALCYRERRYWRNQAAFLAGAAVLAIPFAISLASDLRHLTGRFERISYLHNEALSFVDKLRIFGTHYLEYFQPEFLTWHGDSNRRHHSGYGGQLFIATVVSATVGLIAHFEARSLWRDRFFLLMCCGVLLSPIAAALTSDSQHSLRTLSLGIYLVLVSTYGIAWLRGRKSQVWSVVVMAALVINATAYVWDYFTRFPEASIRAFGEYGFEEAFEQAAKAARQSHGRVVVSNRGPFQYIVPSYFTPMLADPKPKVVMGERDAVKPGDVFVFRDANHKFPELREGVPGKSLFAWQRHGQKADSRRK